MFRVMGKLTLYFDSTGLAAARMEVRAFKVVMMPAFAIETVCCSWLYPHKSCSPSSDSWTNHNFMQDATSPVRHFIKFVNATDPTITQNKGATGCAISRKEIGWIGADLPF